MSQSPLQKGVDYNDQNLKSADDYLGFMNCIRNGSVPERIANEIPQDEDQTYYNENEFSPQSRSI